MELMFKIRLLELAISASDNGKDADTAELYNKFFKLLSQPEECSDRTRQSVQG